jgi:hypothetical protein
MVDEAAKYRYIVCEVFDAPYENSRHRIRARPLPGQWAGPEYRIECPLSIRNRENIGELYKFWAKFKAPKGIQLFTSYHWQPERVSPKEAQAFISAMHSW